MSDLTDVTQLPTDGPAVNAPASGTYGEGAALQRLKASFPTAPAGGSGPGGPPPASPMPLPPSGGGISTAPKGLPAGLTLPTSQPSTPVSTPLAAAPVNPLANAQTARQRNMAILTTLLQDPRSAEETKEWAQNQINLLIQGSKG